jgi:hypothetical protein
LSPLVCPVYGWIEVGFKLEKELTGHLLGKLVQSYDYGTYRVTLDGKKLATVDLFAEQVTPRAYDWGRQTLAAGAHTLRFECMGKSVQSKGYFFGLDSVDMPGSVYERPPGFDLRKIQVQR